MNPFDQAQDLNMAELESIQRRARLPDAPAVAERFCAGCGDDIPPERLVAYPLAVRCIRCQSAHESAQGGFRRG